MRDVFPRSAYSITDLDQAVAATAGATVLGYRIYVALKASQQTVRDRRPPLQSRLSENLEWNETPTP